MNWSATFKNQAHTHTQYDERVRREGDWSCLIASWECALCNGSPFLSSSALIGYSVFLASPSLRKTHLSETCTASKLTHCPFHSSLSSLISSCSPLLCQSRTTLRSAVVTSHTACFHGWIDWGEHTDVTQATTHTHTHSHLLNDTHMNGHTHSLIKIRPTIFYYSLSHTHTHTYILKIMLQACREIVH